MSFNTRLFVILCGAGLAGVFSFLFVDLSALLASFPVTAGQELPLSLPVIKVLNLIQPTIILCLAVAVGVSLAPKVGLSSPVAVAAASGGQLSSALKPQIIPGLIGGIIGGFAIPATWLLWKPFLTPEFVTRAEALNRVLPLATRLLYGGITEELLLRWGLMTLSVWAAWRALQRGRSRPGTICFVSAIIISSVVFGIGHLPLASALAVDFTVPIVSYVVTANSMFGLIAGYLYWKKGLEAAMIGHMVAHLIIVTAVYFGT